jgi:hypothetical protein
MAGYDNLIFGAGVPGLGTDGIMAGDSRLTREVKGEERTELNVSGSCKVDVVTEEVVVAVEA